MTVSDNTNTDIFCNAIEALKDPLPQRVWSVIVSLFGDIAQGEGDQISGVALTEVGRLMGIRPEAIRVALHRLRKDGWIESLRDGRNSMHQLTLRGREDTISATPKIYAQNPAIASDWYVVCTNPSGQVSDQDKLLNTGIPLSRNTFLISADAARLPEDAVVFHANPEQVPDWIKEQCIPQELSDATVSLERSLVRAREFISSGFEFDALQCTALRTMIVHRWRRVALRIPHVPASFFPEDWQGTACRDLAISLLKAVPSPDLCDLEHSSVVHRGG